MATKAAKPDLHIVGPDLDALEQLVVEAAEQTVPAVSRSAALRNRMTLDQRELVSARATFIDRKQLLRGLFDAADSALDAQVSDIDEALSLYANGLGE